MKGIIWYYTDREAGMQRFEQLITDYERVRIYPKKATFNKFNSFVQFDNGDYWSLFPANENMRGAACNVALIEYGTPKEIVDQLIMPCIKSHPYRAYNYWWGDKK